MTILTFVLFAYAVGHLIAYISSITIEKLVHWFYGYPSDFLLFKSRCRLSDFVDHIRFDNKSNHNNVNLFIKGRRHFKNKNLSLKVKIKKLSFWIAWAIRFIYILLMFPISFFSILLFCLKLDGFFTKRLDDYLKEAILKKEKLLASKLALKSNWSLKTDFHRIVDHYVFEKMDGHKPKLNNYVALYDFMRSITLIFDSIFIYFVIYAFFIAPIPLTMSLIWVLIFWAVITYSSFMAFLKFYRRYSLEGYMCLIIDTELNDQCDSLG